MNNILSKLLFSDESAPSLLSEDDTVISGPYRVLRTIKDGDPVEVTSKKSGNQGDDN